MVFLLSTNFFAACGKKENSAVIHRSTVTVYVLRLQQVVLLKPAGKLAIHIIGNGVFINMSDD